jgi:translocation and assembly module TamA
MGDIAWRVYWHYVARCLACAILLWPRGALGLDFFGLFGADVPPSVSQQALPYSLTFKISSGSQSLSQALQAASTLYQLRKEAPVDGQSLVQRAAGDLNPMLDALWGAGYYNAILEIEIAGHHLRVGESPPAGVAAAADAYRGRKVVPVVMAVQPGPLFHLRNIRITNAATGRPFSSAELPARVIKIAPGDPARAADIRVARAALVDWFRAKSHPLAKATATKPIVYHRAHVVDVAISIAEGPYAPFGPVSIAGNSNVDPAVVRSHIYIEPGDPYSPAEVKDICNSVLKIPAISSVRVREWKSLDARGRLPITVSVTDRKPRVIGFSANYSTLDGPDLRAYWQHRNLFGGGESLRLEGEVFMPPQTYESFVNSLKTYRWSDIGGRFKASFVKPALQGTRNDLLLDSMFEKNRTGGDQFGGYTSNSVAASAAIRHRFNASSSAQIGIAGESGQTSDSLGSIDYTLVGIPASAIYDSTDRPLDPTKGLRFSGSLAAYPTFLGSSVGLVESRLLASSYYAVDEDARLVLAGRVAAGSVSGASLGAIPSNHRFYVGGGGSVRGYRYQSLGPLDSTGHVIGGRSMFAASFEARWRMTQTIGLVPFFDMGQAFRASLPDFSETLRYSAGIGLRYFTAVGPIRVDVAFPINRRPGDNSWSLYVGIGQAF